LLLFESPDYHPRSGISAESIFRPVVAAISAQANLGGEATLRRLAIGVTVHMASHTASRTVPSPDSAVSRRALLRGLASAASLLALDGCASLASTGASFDASEISANPTLLVATNRKPVDGARANPWFGPERATRLSIMHAGLTPPGDGRFSLAAVGLDDWRLDAIEPVPQIGDLPGPSSGPRDVLIYVHGFNQTFETAVLDAARLSDGIKFRGDTIAFSWPSKAKLLDYGYDRDSAMWSRDALEKVLDGLMGSPTVGRLHFVAHSIGTMLTMESLRQLYAHKGDPIADRLGAVVFASPDIDMDVFASSVEHIGPVARKITVLTATNDRALALSRWMAGGMTRVGAAQKTQLEQMGLHVVDASQEGWGIVNHDLFLSNGRVRQVIRRAVDSSTGA
jgi:esterase/lipase superfamily enzyme